MPNIFPQENVHPGKYISTFEPQQAKNFNSQFRLGYMKSCSCVDLSQRERLISVSVRSLDAKPFPNENRGRYPTARIFAKCNINYPPDRGPRILGR
jgi:hypothetical protein